MMDQQESSSTSHQTVQSAEHSTDGNLGSVQHSTSQPGQQAQTPSECGSLPQATPVDSGADGVRRHHSDSGTSETSKADGAVHVKALRKTKSVSFHSTTCARQDRKVTSVNDCIQRMIVGDALIKLRPNQRQYHRFFSLTSDLSAICWMPSRKASRAKVLVDSIKEVRCGRTTPVFRNGDFSELSSDECAFSIIYGEDYASLDLIAASPDEANVWITGLKALIAPVSADTVLDAASPAAAAAMAPSFSDSVPASATTAASADDDNGRWSARSLRERWLADMFARAVDNDASAASLSTAMQTTLDRAAAVQLMRKLNSQIATVRLEQRLTECENVRGDTCDSGRLTSREFIDLFKEVATRPEVYFLLLRHSNKEYMTADDLHIFLEGEQGMMGLTREKCLEMIRRFEPNPESKQKGHMMIDGLMRYLMSDECDVFSERHRCVCHDMSQPLTQYFIASSHNTYLLQDQLRGPSSCEGYSRALLNGCRCVKVDCWDDKNGEPVVYHGNTLTSRVAFSEVASTINEFAFCVSEYPLILHIENHCSIAVQKRLVEILQQTFGSRLYTPPHSPSHSTVSSGDLVEVTDLSPHQLRHRILIMGRKLLDTVEDNEDGEVADENEECPGPTTSETSRHPLCRQLSNLVSLRWTSVRDSLAPHIKERSGQVLSLSETHATRISQSGHVDQLLQASRSHVTRVFPSVSRVDSSNYNPQDFWNFGCQIVALNYQTPGSMMDVYDGRFRDNGCCGYVLKPAVLRTSVGYYSPLHREPVPGVAAEVLRIKVISGQQLPRPRGSTAVKATVVDPYVLLQVFGAPCDCTEARGRTVTNEGNSPVFDESFEFVITLPELALIRFVVLDDDFIGDDFIGQYTAPLKCLQQGYRHVKLLSSIGEPLDNVTLFVHISICSQMSGSLSRRKNRNDKNYSELRIVGLKDVDDFFKTSVTSLVSESQRWCTDVTAAMTRLQGECGLGTTANVRQCVRVLLHRLANCATVTSFTVQHHDQVPVLRVTCEAPTVASCSSGGSSGVGAVSAHLQRSLNHLDTVLKLSARLVDECDALVERLGDQLSRITELCWQLDQRCQTAGVKGRKKERARENIAWNARLVQGQMDLLNTCRTQAEQRLQQMRSSQDMVTSFSRELNTSSSSSVVRGRYRKTLPCLTIPPESSSVYPVAVTSAPPSGRPCIGLPSANLHDTRPKSILKKSHSTAECSGHVALTTAARTTTLPTSTRTPETQQPQQQEPRTHNSPQHTNTTPL